MSKRKISLQDLPAELNLMIIDHLSLESCLALSKTCKTFQQLVDLEKWMSNRGMSPIDQKLAIKWLQELTEILHQVHQQNFFHRDIKPANIMLKADGNLALIDFGTVRQLTETYEVKIAAGREVTGIISAGYTPNEQMNGHAEPCSDFFALGRTFVYPSVP